MAYQQSYFALGELHPLRFLERLLNPYQPLADTVLQGHPLAIFATRRAAKALTQRDIPLIVEMQLYFSCVVKKRVLFHDTQAHSVHPVSDKLRLLFRPVEALSCDPVEFAANYPERRQLTSTAATKMLPSRLFVDFRHGRWVGDFTI